MVWLRRAERAEALVHAQRLFWLLRLRLSAQKMALCVFFAAHVSAHNYVHMFFALAIRRRPGHAVSRTRHASARQFPAQRILRQRCARNLDQPAYSS